MKNCPRIDEYLTDRLRLPYLGRNEFNESIFCVGCTNDDIRKMIFIDDYEPNIAYLNPNPFRVQLNLIRCLIYFPSFLAVDDTTFLGNTIDIIRDVTLDWIKDNRNPLSDKIGNEIKISRIQLPYVIETCYEYGNYRALLNYVPDELLFSEDYAHLRSLNFCINYQAEESFDQFNSITVPKQRIKFMIKRYRSKANSIYYYH